MRVTFVIPVIASGGAEHALVILARRWAAGGRQVTILTYDDGASAPFYELDPRIRHVPMGIARDSSGLFAAVGNNLRRARILRREVRRSRPDVVVSFIDQTNVLTLVATEGLSVPVVVVEQSDPHTFPVKAVWARLRLLTYARARRIVLLSAHDAAFFPPRLRGRVAVIPNPFVPPPEATEEGSHDAATQEPTLIAVGRLHRDKGFDILLEAFALLREQHPAWRLTVLGEGEERGRLEALRDRLHLGEHVSLPGRVRDPYTFLRRATLFALPSRAEGFPLALCEALACGLPAVCTDCAGGVRDIIEDGVNGLLVPKEDAGALARALGRLMSDETERRRLAQRAPEVVERFNPRRTFEAWESLLREVSGDRKVLNQS
ncbi:MAG TPA: glycosyltransferase family 4 protein [Pyrinomonadaceae bacterium]|nr:glycosyltransferase family 4 protein [Pyrinomonadaceae bacterium]